MRRKAQPQATDTTPIGGEKTTLSLGLLAAMLCCALAFLGIGASAASAAPQAQPGYGFLVDFGKDQFSFFATQPRNPIAVDGNGNIFAINENFGQVMVFAPDASAGGTTLTTLSPPDMLPRDLAIDRSNNVLYLQDPGTFDAPKIRRYISNGQPSPAYTADPGFELASGADIAVDPVSHDLFVADPGAEGIRRYSTAGTLLGTIATPGVAPSWVVVAPDGSIYFAPADGSTVFHVDSSGTALNQIAAGGAIEAFTVDPASGRLIIAAAGVLNLYSTTGAFLSDTQTPSDSAFGLAVDPATGRVYEFGSDRLIHTYVPATWPGIEGVSVSGIGHHSAHFSAEVDPGAGPPAESEARFEYSADGGATWTSTAYQPLAGPATIEADVAGLIVNWNYLLRVRARNSLTTHTTQPQPFSTPEVAPEVETGAATDVSETSAVLNGTINPAGLQTTYHFEYGLTAAYGSRVPVGIEAVAGNDRQSRIFSRTIPDLVPGTTYHFRLVAVNALGATAGADRTFTTLTGFPNFAYEQVSPVDKHGNPLESGVAFQAKADGSAFSYAFRGGVSSPLQARWVSFRNGGSWEPALDLTPPLGITEARIVAQTVLAVSDDFTHTLVATNESLTPDAPPGGRSGVNLYIGDIATHTWRFVGHASTMVGSFISTQQGDKFIGGSPDFSSVVFYSIPPLLPTAPFGALYQWSAAGGLEVASVLPDGTQSEVAVTFSKGPAIRSVSADGSRIYFTVPNGPNAGLYLRQGGQTKAVSVSQVAGEPTTPFSASLIGSSEDGRYAFFQSQGKLTPGAPGSGSDVYRYDAVDGSLLYTGAAAALNGPSFDLSNGVGVSRDGQVAYWRGNSDVWTWRDGVAKVAVAGNTLSDSAFVSPNGRYLAYRIGVGLDPTTNEPIPNVKIYDSLTGQTECPSCLSDGSYSEGFLPEGLERFVSNRISRVVTDSGRMFFTSSERLVAADVNGQRDVYMFEHGNNYLISPGNARYDAIYADASVDGSSVFFSTNQKLVGQDNDQVTDVYVARVGGGLPGQNPPPPRECLRDDCKATPQAGPELPFGGSEALSGPENVKPKKKARCGKGRHAKKLKGKTRCVKSTHKAGKTKHKAGKGKKGRGR